MTEKEYYYLDSEPEKEQEPDNIPEDIDDISECRGCSECDCANCRIDDPEPEPPEENYCGSMNEPDYCPHCKNPEHDGECREFEDNEQEPPEVEPQEEPQRESEAEAF